MFIRVFHFLFYFINLFFVKCCLNYVAGYVYFQFATCGGFKVCATKGLHFPPVNLSTCLVFIEVFFLTGHGKLVGHGRNCVPTVFVLQNRRLKRTTSNTDLLPLTPISSSSSSALRSIILFHFYGFAPLPFLSMSAFYCFVCLTVSHILSFISSHPLEQKMCK